MPATTVLAQSYFVRFPNDVYLLDCQDTFGFFRPEFYNPDTLPLQAVYTDTLLPSPVDLCLRVGRRWLVYDSAYYDPAMPCMVVPNPTPSLFPPFLGNLIGPTVSAPGTTLWPWAPTSVPITADNPSPTDFSQFWSATANCYQYDQWIDLYDTNGPALSGCTVPVTLTDGTANDSLLWHDAMWWDPEKATDDLREYPVDLALSVYDSCTGDGVDARYLLFLDLDLDDVWETVVNSQNPPPPGYVYFGNAGNPDFGGGELRRFDNRPGVDSLLRYRFFLERVPGTSPRTYRLRWGEGQFSGTVVYSIPQLPHGRSRLHWYGDDGCGNETHCWQDVLVEAGLLATGVAPEVFFGVSVQPNPVSGAARLQFGLATEAELRLQLWTSAGQPACERRHTFPAGEHAFALGNDELRHGPGVYFWRLEAAGAWQAGRIVLLP